MQKIKIENYPMVNPTPIVLIGTTVEHKENYTTVGAFGVVCCDPLFYISLKSTHHATAGIRESGFFSVNIPSAEMLQKTDYCGLVSGKTTDKSKVFPSFYDELGDAPMICEAPLNYLCKVVKSVPVNDFEVFFGEIVAAYGNEDCMVEGTPDALKISPIVGMAATYYTLGKPIGKVFQEGKS